jgi:RNA polymerase sigma-70 factor (ECF subfamily)
LRHQSSTGNGQTVEELFEQHSEKLFAYLRQHTSTREDAEDVLVDTFMAALADTKFAHLPESGQVAWLWRVARNKVVDTFRKATVRRSIPLEQVDETPCEEDARDPEQAALRQDEQREMHDLLQALPELQQEVLRLRFGYDLRSGEIAAILGKREDAVRAMLSRSMNTLRQLYAQRSTGARQSKSDQQPGNMEESDE